MLSRKVLFFSCLFTFAVTQSFIQKADAQGANVPFVSYEAENGASNATKLSYGTTYRTVESEASGRGGVRLQATGNYVEFTLTKPANGLVFRYSIPDASGGGGMNATLAMYINSQKYSDVALTSKYAWVYGDYPYWNSPDSRPHRFFDDTNLILDKVYPAGTKIKLQKDAANTASYYIIDLMEAEEIPAANQKPANSVSIADYGARPGDDTDDTNALLSAISAAASSGKEVWIPEGVYDFRNSSLINITNNNVIIRGAGMWRTTLVITGKGSGFMVKANNVEFHDFRISGIVTQRENDNYQCTAIESDYHTANMQKLTIKNIWIEHTTVGIWIHNMNQLYVGGCRVRNVYADGIHLRKGTCNSTVENNHVRNTGDDGIALWSSDIANANNKIRFNTVGMPCLASGIAVYGGSNNEITDNLIHDIIFVGGGVNVSAAHSPVAFSGTVTVKGNELNRCGSKGDWDVERGAVWINVAEPIPAKVIIESNKINNSSYSGLSVNDSKTIQEISVKSNTFNTAGTYGISIDQDCSGRMVLCGNTFSGCKSGNIRNDSGNRLSVVNGNDCSSTPQPIPSITIKVRDTQNWGRMSVYAYGNGEIFGSWPGQTMTSEGNGWYSCTIPNTNLPINIIFNNNDNGKKTVDIMNVNADVCYKVESSTWNNQGIANDVSNTGCLPTGINTLQSQSVSIDPNPASDFVFINSEKEVREVSMRDVNGRLVLKSIPDHNSVNLNGLSSGLYFVELKFAEGNRLYQRLIKK